MGERKGRKGRKRVEDRREGKKGEKEDGERRQELLN